MAFLQVMRSNHTSVTSEAGDDVESLLPTLSSRELGDRQSKEDISRLHVKRTRWLCTSSCGLILLTALNIILFMGTLIGFPASSQLNRDLRRTSTYSPIHDKFDLELYSRTIQGTLFPSKDGASIAREMPNAAADEVWEDWELTRFLPLTEADIVKMGKDPSTVPKLDDKQWGLGDNAYIGVFDVFHHIHCLNSLRRIIYRSYYNETMPNPESMGLPEIHVNHCIDILLQAIQCSGNVNLMTYHWVAGQEYPQPDMSINRQCINFDKLTAWRKENALDPDKYLKTMKKSLHQGVKERHQSDAYYEYFREENPNHVNGANPGEDFNL